MAVIDRVFYCLHDLVSVFLSFEASRVSGGHLHVPIFA